jgi:hypothetical protein
MRLQLATVLVLVAGTAAHADGTLAMRGVYYKERSTRVMQPMLDGMFEVGARGLVTAHVLVDAITSASAGSGTANAVPFSEKRYEAGAGYTQELDGPAGSIIDKIRVGGDARFSTESDYRSIYFGPRAEADLAQKNMTLGIGGGLSSDRVDASGAASALGSIKLLCKDDVEHGITKAMSDSCPLTVYNAYATVAQIVSKDAVVGATYDIAYLDGYQSNPYRSAIVPAENGFEHERHPFTRLRQSIAGSARYYYAPSQTTFIGAYRHYWDSWGIHAHTPELRIVQEVGEHADATVAYRYYTQDAAFFWARFYAPPTETRPYLTDDPKMSAFDGHVMEAKLGIFGEAFDLHGRWAGARFEGILEYIIQHNRFGNAVEAHVALTLPFSY